ncbi:hypothetical protein [Lactococcus cremoris]|uniref:hypothetical protein n=1 Tax=Lactococcus lactis subsp. cremoris TaxID=1359 RepID=UPI0021820089|nr:hypothetical protein [Lactococcus cremoris]MCT0506481.1 hypothetical protein [Lactococcus cremoris]
MDQSIITPRDDFEKEVFSMLVLTNLELEAKDRYKKYFLRVANDAFIEQLPYDRITEFIYNKRLYDTSGIDLVIAEIVESIRKDDLSTDIQRTSAESCLEKIRRHIHLALVQYEFIVENIEEKQTSINDLNMKLYQAQQNLEILSRELESKVSEVEKSINGNQLAILSIFAGIVTTFIGGFGVSINVFSNLINNVPLPKIIVSASILFIGISCVIFLLLVTAARIVNHNLFFANNKRTLVLVIRMLALICLGAALVYQLEFSKENHVMIKQGIWFEQYAKWIEIGITVLMIGITAIPKPIFKIHRWIENKIRD